MYQFPRFSLRLSDRPAICRVGASRKLHGLPFIQCGERFPQDCFLNSGGSQHVARRAHLLCLQSGHHFSIHALLCCFPLRADCKAVDVFLNHSKGLNPVGSLFRGFSLMPEASASQPY